MPQAEAMPVTALNSQDAELPVDSLKALDWLNFFLAALLMGFGPFVAVHLAENGWAPASIGAIARARRDSLAGGSLLWFDQSLGEVGRNAEARCAASVPPARYGLRPNAPYTWSRRVAR